MKRYEKMSKEEIMDTMCMKSCDKCIVGEEQCKEMTRKGCTVCSEVKFKWLNQDIKMKPRYEVYKTEKEATEAFEEFCNKHICTDCDYHDPMIDKCEISWLYDKEEVDD